MTQVESLPLDLMCGPNAGLLKVAHVHLQATCVTVDI